MSLDVWIEQFYQITDADDWSKAYRRALSHWIGYTNEVKYDGAARGFTLRFMAKEYRFSEPIDVVRGMHLVGSGGAGFPGGTQLIFPFGVDGIVVHSVINLDPPGPPPNAVTLTGHDLELFNRGLSQAPGFTAPEGLHSLRGSGAVIERLALYGLPAPGGAAPREAHGIAARSVCTLRDLYIDNFSGNGIDIRAWVPTWNANSWQIHNCLVSNCQDGFYCWGSDVNAGCAVALNCVGNRGWGIWDASFLGNTYIACHSDGNAEGSYRTGTARDGSARGVSSNVFLGCYSEGTTWPGSRVVLKAPTVVVGGTIGPVQHWRDMGLSDAQMETDPAARAIFEQYRSTATMLFNKGYGGLFPNGGVTGEGVPDHVNSPATGRSRAYGRLGSDVHPNTALSFGWVESVDPVAQTELGAYRLAYQFKSRPEEKGWWALSAGEGDEIGPPLRLSTNEAAENRGHIWFQNGYYLGGGNNLFEASGDRPRIRVLTGRSAPTTGKWQVGDRILNAAPAPGGWSGWICVTAGEPGVWMGFGKIES